MTSEAGPHEKPGGFTTASLTKLWVWPGGQ